MGEYVWTSISIGGKGSHALIVDELPGAVAINFSGDGCGASIDEVIAGALANRTSATFQGECNFGQAEELTAFCRENGLAYHLSYAAVSGQFDAGLEYWAPGMAAPETESASDDGEPMANLSWLQDQAKAGKTLADVLAALQPADVSNVPALEPDDLVTRAGAAEPELETA